MLSKYWIPLLITNILCIQGAFPQELEKTQNTNLQQQLDNLFSDDEMVTVNKKDLKPKDATKKKKFKGKSTFQQAFIVDHNIRLALTPKITGKINEEQWDKLSSSNEITSYFQWEPGYIYLAATVPTGRDLVVTLDTSGKGWFNGKNNIEIRVHWDKKKPTYTLRRLDSTNPNEPTWTRDRILEKVLQMKGSEVADSWKVEMRILCIGLPKIKAKSRIGVRFDSIEPGEKTPPPYVPRAVSFITLDLSRARNKSLGLKWNSMFKSRSVTPSEKIIVDFNVERYEESMFKTVKMRTKGFSKETATSIEQPFPAFNKKGEAHFKYKTKVPGGSLVGYRILEAQLKRKRGKPTILETCYLIAKPIVFDVKLPKNLIAEHDKQIVKGRILVRSHSMNRLEGDFNLKVPKDWTIKKGETEKFWVYHSHGMHIINIELEVPKYTSGLFPIKCSAKLKNYGTVEKTYYLPIKKKKKKNKKKEKK